MWNLMKFYDEQISLKVNDHSKQFKPLLSNIVGLSSYIIDIIS
jgi:hypothetical protein